MTAADPALHHPLTLRFPTRKLERGFRAAFFDDSRRLTRAMLLLTIGLYLGFGMADRWVFPAYSDDYWAIRIAFCTFAAAVFWATWHPAFPKVRTLLLSTVLFLAALGVQLMIWMMGIPGHESYFNGLILIILGGNALYRLPFGVIVAVSLGIFGSYELQAIVIDRMPQEIVIVNTFVLVCTLVIGIVASYNLERFARVGYYKTRRLEEEEKRSERLLLNILPSPIAERLKRQEGPIAEEHESASILFADIVGFTQISSRMRPEAVVRMLNTVFTVFDHIARRYGLEKIKTVGDAYMAVAGIPIPQIDHMERIADAALEMRRQISGIDVEEFGALRVRIGIDTGPVVAGVIGETKFVYDVWGDAVTTASRMESHGLADEIMVSEAVQRRLADRYELHPRGEIQIKGKGPMRTWLLMGNRPVAAVIGAEETPRPRLTRKAPVPAV